MTEEDWRNRENWDLYREALVEMINKTTTSYARWTVVESNDKYYSRLKTLKTVVDYIGALL
jgi:polyphosphate kinase 2 (PPK2 family)